MTRRLSILFLFVLAGFVLAAPASAQFFWWPSYCVWCPPPAEPDTVWIAPYHGDVRTDAEIREVVTLTTSANSGFLGFAAATSLIPNAPYHPINAIGCSATAAPGNSASCNASGNSGWVDDSGIGWLVIATAGDVTVRVRYLEDGFPGETELESVPIDCSLAAYAEFCDIAYDHWPW